MTARRARGDEGYAMVAAVAAVAGFSALAFTVMASERGTAADVGALATRARLEAAAEAGLATAVSNLAQTAQTARWSLDGRPHLLDFDGVRLSITVEDERGKAPVGELDEAAARRLFAAAGATGGRLDTLVDSYMDWVDDDQDRRPHGAEGPDYAPQGVRPRDGRPRTVDELALLKGMDAPLFARIRPALTPFFGRGGFSRGTAQRLAAIALTDASEDSPEDIERRREEAGQRTAIDLAAEPSLIGRAVTVRVAARTATGGSLQRATVVEMTGRPDAPVWVRMAQ